MLHDIIEKSKRMDVYSRCDKLSLYANLVRSFWHCHPYFILNFIYICDIIVHTHSCIHMYTADCGVPSPTCSSSITMNYSSTLEGSTLTFNCKEGFAPSDGFIATCHPNGSWFPDPTTHVCTRMTSGKI
jgi:hypothetical protein